VPPTPSTESSPTPAGSRRAGATPLVGRSRELARLRVAIDDAIGGHGGVVFVTGEPGIGKTRLVAEASVLAKDAGTRVAWGTCVADAPPYWPWRQVLRAAGLDEETLDTGEASADEGARFRLFETIAERLHDVARAQPLVVVLDDLQWSDVPSLRLFAFAARTLQTRPLLVLGTFRDTEIDAAYPVRELVGELGAALSVVSLEGLGPQGVEWLLSEQMGPVSQDLARDVQARTGGNPFFVREVAHFLDETGDAAASGVPPAVAEVVRRELAGCSDDCSALLAAAATAGGDLDLDLLSTVLDTSAPDLVRRTEEAHRRRILDRDNGGYRFRHDLVREAVLSTLAPDQQATLHWDVGSALAASSRIGGAEEAARHLRSGMIAGDRVVAIEAAFRAAREAMTALAFEQAVDHLDWIVEQAHQGTATPDAVDELELLLMLGDARLRAGDWEGAGEAFESAGQLAREQNRPEDLGRAALGFGSGRAGFEVPLIDHRQLGPLEEAATALAGTDSIVGAHVLARLAVAGFYLDEPTRREQLARDAMAMAERTGDPAARAHALAAWCDMLGGPEHTETRLDAGAEITRLGQEAGDDELGLIGHRFRVVAFLEQGDIAGADREIRAFERVADRYRLPIVRWYVPLWRGMRALLQGDLDEAEAHTHEAEVIGQQAGSENAELLTSTLREWIGQARGRIPPDLVEHFRTAVETYLATNPDVGSARAGLIWVALDAGDLDEARQHLDVLARLGYGERDAEWLGTLWLATDACAALDDERCAAEVAALLEPFEARFAIDGIGATVIGCIGEALGVLDIVRGRRQQGEARLRRAIERYEQMGAPLLAARARDRLGAPVRAPAPASTERGTMRRAGDVWVLDYRGREVRLRDAKGLRDLAVLLGQPNREVHVSELTGGGVATAATIDVIDDGAKAAYRSRIAELEADVTDAEDAHDLERATRAREELEFLVDELAASLGLGGRVRGASDDQERARKAVTGRIRYVIDRVESEHPELGRHLAVSIRTGTFCSYAPDRPVAWNIAT
jgi:tetratricopeptide (TPR) repeat protein